MRSLNRFLAALWLAVAAFSAVSATPVAASQFVPAYGTSAGSVSPLIVQAAFTGPRRALLSGNKASGPTWLGNFLSGVLPSGVSVSSPSLGGLVTDASGKLTYKPNNLLAQSNTFTDASWHLNYSGTGAVPVLTPNAGTDPLGGNNAWRLQLNLGATPSTAISDIYNVSIPALVTKGISAIWVKTYDGSTKTIFLQGDAGAVPIVVNGTWSQIYLPNKGATYSFGLYGAVSGISTSADLLVFNATHSAVTYETSPRPGDQVITTSSAYYGPAWDYDTSGNALGLRVWESRQNVLTYSESLNNLSGWTNSGVASVVATASPTSGMAAFLVTTNGVNGLIYQAAGNAPTKAFQVIAKAGTSSTFRFEDTAAGDGSYVDFDLSAGTAGSPTVSGAGNSTITNPKITSIGGGWYLCTMTVARTNVSSNFILRVVGASGSTMSFGRPQSEPNVSVAGPYIPTSSAAVTAAADVVTSAAPWFSPQQGTFYASFDIAGYPAGAGYFGGIVGVGGSAPRAFLNVASGTSRPVQAQVYDGTNGVSFKGADFNDLSTSQAHRASFAYTTTTGQMALDGAAGTQATTSAVNFTSITKTLFVGNRPDTTAYLNGHIKQIAYYNVAHSAATLQAKTVANASFSANDNIPDWLRHSYAANDNATYQMAAGD